MLVLIEDTPNPNALKFSTVPDSTFSPAGPLYFENKEQAVEKSDFVVELFDLEVVDAVFLGDNFVTVTVHSSTNFDQLKSEVINLVLKYLGNNISILKDSENLSAKNSGDAATKNTAINTDLEDAIEKKIIEIIATKIKPSVAMDGGDVAYHSFVDGVVKVKLRGACSGCPSAQMTLKDGIESTLKYYIPEVESVEAVNAMD